MQQSIDTTNPYMALWNRIKPHLPPLITEILQGIVIVIVDVLCLHFLVLLATWGHAIGKNFVEAFRRAVLAAGKVAESAFIVGTFYVLCFAVAQSYLIQLFGQNTINSTNHIVLLIFTGLPELILLEALFTVVERASIAWELKGTKSFAFATIWTILTLIPVTFFVGVTVYTIVGYVGSSDNNFNMTQLTGLALLFRVIPGWFYAIINGLYGKFGKSIYTSHVESLKQSILAGEEAVKQRDANIISLEQKNELLRSDATLLQEQLHVIERELVELKARKQARKQQAQKSSESQPLQPQNSLSVSATGSQVSQSKKVYKSVLRQDVAVMLGIRPSDVSRLINSGSFKCAPNTAKQRVTIGSIRDYAKEKNITLKQLNQDDTSNNVPTDSGRDTEQLPATNGHSNESVSLNELAEMLV